jgi:hypothetical protein
MEQVPAAFQLTLPTAPSQPRVIRRSSSVSKTPPQSVAAPVQKTQSAPPATTGSFPWSRLLTIIYAIGVALLLGRLFAGWRAARRILAASRPIRIGGIAAHECSLLSSPVTVGLRSPQVVLPEDWTEWPEVKLTAVLAHEEAHVRRRDTLSSFFAHLNRCVFWFHPVAWWLERRLALDAEQACDDAGVLAVGGSQRYTEVLLDIAERARRGGRRMVLQGVGADGAGLLAPRIERLVRGSAGGRASAAQKMLLGCACALTVFAGAACHQKLPELKPDPKVAENQKRSKASQAEWEEINKMSAEQAHALEASLVKDPENMELRAKLMRFYQSRGRDVLGDSAATAGFYAQQLWCIEHHPENGCSASHPPLFDAASYQRGAALWEAALKRPDLSADARLDALFYFQTLHPERAVEILKGTAIDEKERNRRLGGIYISALTGPASAGPFAQQVRKELEETKNAGLLTAVGERMTFITVYGNAVMSAERLQLHEAGRKYLERAAALEPESNSIGLLARYDQREAQRKISEDLRAAGLSGAPSDASYQKYVALSTADRVRFLPYLIMVAYSRAADDEYYKHDKNRARIEWDIARRYAHDALTLASDPAAAPSSGELVYVANMALGLIAERLDGNSHQAAQYLLAASDADTHNSNWQILPAQKLCLLLLHYGGAEERQAVITFLDRQAKFTPKQQMDYALAAQQIRQGTMPSWYQYQVANLK